VERYPDISDHAIIGDERGLPIARQGWQALTKVLAGEP
jgi:hypothetical protein